MPKMDGLEMCQKIRNFNQQQHIVLFTGYNEVDYLSKAINMNINKYIMKPLNTRQMFDTLDEIVSELQKEKEREAYKKDLEFASNHDLLTGLANRKLFFTRLEQLVSDSLREKKSVAILSMDLNRFKPINDTYGHDVGDIAIKELVRLITENIKGSDVVARFGGEEFCVLLKNIDKSSAVEIFVRLRLKVANNVININNNKIQYTISTGLTFNCDEGVEEMLNQADMALYNAKNSGRNRVEISE